VLSVHTCFIMCNSFFMFSCLCARLFVSSFDLLFSLSRSRVTAPHHSCVVVLLAFEFLLYYIRLSASIPLPFVFTSSSPVSDVCVHFMCSSFVSFVSMVVLTLFSCTLASSDVLSSASDPCLNVPCGIVCFDVF